MIRWRLAIPVLIASLGCGGHSTRSAQTSPVGTIEAGLLPPTHGIGFYVNQPLHVAIFDVVPGRGIGLIYPKVGRELGVTRAGTQWVTPAYGYMSQASYTPRYSGGARYLFLVASKQPLNIEDYVGYSDYLREKFGNVLFAGNAYRSMKALISEVVPEQPEGDYTTALYIVYGRPGSRPTQMFRLVRCEPNRFFWVPVERLFICPPASDSSTVADSLKQKKLDESKPDAPKDKNSVMAFDPGNAPDAADILRRPVVKVDRAPYAPPPRTTSVPEGRASSYNDAGRGRRDNDGPTLPDATGSTATVVTPAQTPSNDRGGRVADPATSP